jgi:hypothetical protein
MRRPAQVPYSLELSSSQPFTTAQLFVCSTLAIVIQTNNFHMHLLRSFGSFPHCRAQLRLPAIAKEKVKNDGTVYDAEQSNNENNG